VIPVIFSIGPIHLFSYGLCLAAGMLVSLFLMRRRASREGFPKPDDCSDMMFWLFIWGFSGARLLYVLQNSAYYLSNPLKIFAVWEGGLIFYGGTISALLGFWVTARIQKHSFWRLLDFIVPYVALTQFFGRVGCFLNGCCYGKTCSLPWAVHFPQSSGPVHPTQLYEAGYSLVLFFFLQSRTARTGFNGKTGLLYFMLYAAGRYLTEFVREQEIYWLGFTFNQWVSLVLFALALAIFLMLRRAASRQLP